jgi:hypothetical protein
MSNSFISISNNYTLNTEKLLQLSKQEPEYYKFILDMVSKYLDVLNNMNKDSAINFTLAYLPEYRFLIENTLVSANILVTKRQSKIEKVLNSK